MCVKKSHCWSVKIIAPFFGQAARSREERGSLVEKLDRGQVVFVFGSARETGWSDSDVDVVPRGLLRKTRARERTCRRDTRCRRNAREVFLLFLSFWIYLGIVCVCCEASSAK